MVRGFTQSPGMNLFETFSQVIGFDIVLTILAISTMRRRLLGPLEFKQAYLNAVVLEDTWLEPPNGSNIKSLKAIYGLKRLELN